MEETKRKKEVDVAAIVQRTRSGFSSVPGLYPLTQGEAQEDIDYFRSASTYEYAESKLKRKKKSSDADSFEAKVDDEGHVTKRSKTGQKPVSLKLNCTSLRAHLNAMRQEERSMEDSTVQMKRDIEFAREEKKSLEHKFQVLREEYNQEQQNTVEQRTEYEKSIQSLQDELGRETELATQREQQLSQWENLQQDLRSAQVRVHDLRKELLNRVSQMKMYQQAVPRSGKFLQLPPIPSFENALSNREDLAVLNANPPVGDDLVSFVKYYGQKWEECERQLKQVQERSQQARNAFDDRDNQYKEISQQLEDRIKENHDLMAQTRKYKYGMKEEEEKAKVIRAEKAQLEVRLQLMRKLIDIQKKKDKYYHQQANVAAHQAKKVSEMLDNMMRELKSHRGSVDEAQTRLNVLYKGLRELVSPESQALARKVDNTGKVEVARMKADELCVNLLSIFSTRKKAADETEQKIVAFREALAEQDSVLKLLREASKTVNDKPQEAAEMFSEAVKLHRASNPALSVDLKRLERAASATISN